MRKLILLIAIVLCSTVVSAQTIWDSVQAIATENYEIKVPHKWRLLQSGSENPEQIIEASGLALPAFYNNAPVIVTLFMVKQESKNLEEAKEKCLNGYRLNSDRVFPIAFKEGQEKVTVSSGQEAYILNTRFFRKSKGLNQSRFDLVIYSNKAKIGYFYTLSVQYYDNEYKFETEKKVSDFAKIIFSNLTLK